MLGPTRPAATGPRWAARWATTAPAPHSILYGMIADNVLAVEAVLADGRAVRFDERFFEQPPAGAVRLAAELQRILATYGDAIRRDFPRHWRRASGYNLDKSNPAQLIAGSEGTLAFMTEITLRARCRGRPAPRSAMVHFDDLVAAAEATPFLLELKPSAVELMDKLLLDLCRQHPAYGQRLTFVEGDPACVLAVEFYVESEAEGRARLESLARPTCRSRPPRRGRAAVGAGGAGQRLGRAQGRADSAAGPARRRQAGRLHGGRGRAGGAFAGLCAQRAAHDGRARQAGRLLRPRQRRLPAHPPPAQPQDGRGHRGDGRHAGRAAGADPAAGRGAQWRARRWPQADPPQPGALRRGGDTRLRRDQAGFRSGQPVQPRQEGDGGCVGGRSRERRERRKVGKTWDGACDRSVLVALWARVPHHRAATAVRLVGRRRAGAGGGDVQWVGRLPQGQRGDVPLVPGHARGGAQHARPGQPAARRPLRPIALKPRSGRSG